MTDAPRLPEKEPTPSGTPPEKVDSPFVGLVKQLKWFHATRTLGVTMVLYGMFGDKTPERATLILTGAGFLGFDFVKRSESK